MQDQSITAYNVLAPIVVRNIREAFDGAVKEIESRRGVDAPDATRAKIARQIVGLAKHGECDVNRLRAAALSALPY